LSPNLYCANQNAYNSFYFLPILSIKRATEKWSKGHRWLWGLQLPTLGQWFDAK